ncbi:hypothetical protein SDC9_103061 [bioreactor metagenome]|uniref:Uncharacterized protein n=1 Tax=bioreactor metagenome TaxID=1076179 RepID=A0A645AT55_9ZZZZ
MIFIDLRHLYDHNGNTAVVMSKGRTQKGFMINILHIFPGKKIQTVNIITIIGYRQFLFRMIDPEHCFKKISNSLLNVLSDGMKIGCESGRYRENSLIFLAFALGKKLFEPFGKIAQGGIVIDQNFNGLSFIIKNISCRRIAVAAVLGQIRTKKFMVGVIGACHDRIYIGAGHRDRQQPHRC